MTDPTTSTQFCEQHPFGTLTACPACAEARAGALQRRGAPRRGRAAHPRHRTPRREPRPGRLERTLAKSALARLREAGLALPTPPADDVREALIDRLRRPVWDAPGYANEAQAPMVADAVLASFEVRPRGTATDAEVDAAARSLAGLSEAIWAELVQEARPELAYYVNQARAALKAAREVHP